MRRGATLLCMSALGAAGCVAPVEPLTPPRLPDAGLDPGLDAGPEEVPAAVARCPGVARRATSWRHPRDFEEGASAGRAAVYPAARLSNLGRGFVAWNQSQPDQLVVQESADGVWQDPRASDLGFLAPMLPRFEAQVAANTCGEAIAVWPALDGERLQLRFRRFDGAQWGPLGVLLPDLSLQTRTVSYQVAMEEDGRALVAWTYPRAGFVSPPRAAGQVLAARVDVVGRVQPLTWSPEVVAVAPALAARGDGTVFAAWASADPERLQTAVIDREGRLGPPDVVHSGATSGAPRVASTIRGNTVLTFVARERGLGTLHLAERQAGVWTTPRPIADMPLGADFDVGLSDDGTALLVWRTSEGQTQVSLRRPDQAWDHDLGSARPLRFGDGDARRPRVAFDAAGNAVLAWLQFVEGRCNSGLCSRVYLAELRDGRLEEPRGLEDAISLPGTSANFPRVASNGPGQFIVTWAQRDPSECADGCWSVYRSERR